MFNSVTFNATHSALDALADRQLALADNIANVNTPMYRSKRVSFEGALRAALESGSGEVQATTKLSLEPTRANGNNVNISQEMLQLDDTKLRYQLATQVMSSQFSGIRTAIKAA